MKKLINLLIVISMVFCMAACGRRASHSISNTSSSTIATFHDSLPNDVTESSSEATEFSPDFVPPLRRQSIGFDTEAHQKMLEQSYPEMLEQFGLTWDTEVHLDIPIYSDCDLLYSDSFLKPFRFTYDAAYNLIKFPAEWYTTEHQLAMFPTNAVRVREDGSSYAIYRSDTGYRVYVFFTAPPESSIVTGYPIAINDSRGILSLNDFASIQVGDPIEKVEAIDDVATVHKLSMPDAFSSSLSYEERAKEGNPCVSVHYLKDGLLIIEYTVVDVPNIVVAKRSFYEDYLVIGADGKTVNYKIKDIDIPTPTNTDNFPVPLPKDPPLLKRASSSPQESFAETLQRLGVPWDSEDLMDIPVYSYVDLFYAYDGFCYELHLDSSFGNNYHSDHAQGKLFYADRYLTTMPENTFRIREDGTSYAVYDSDNGYRLYISFTEPEPGVLTGHPIVVNKSRALLSKSDFDSIKVGDPMEKVEGIDTVTTLYRKSMPYSHIAPSNFEDQAKKGNPYVSVHYLKDGLLIIEYTMVEQPNIIVSKISFYEDYVVPTADGKMTSHKIKDIDLPQP